MPKVIFGIAIIISIIALQYPLFASTNSIRSKTRTQDYCLITGKKILLLKGKVLKFSEKGLLKIDIKGFVRKIFYLNNALYYLKTADSSDRILWNIGYKDLSSGASFESELKIDMKGRIIKRFSGSDRTAFILSGEPDSSSSNTLHRIDLNKMEVTVKGGILDFCIIKSSPLLIQRYDEQGALFIYANDRRMPLSLKGNLYFKRIIDGRILFITNGSETEVIDIVNFRNLYQYSDKIRYMIPEKFNLIVKTVDKFEIIKGKKIVFYKININGRESGRTETGLSTSAKYFRAGLKPNKYYILDAERWELNKSRKRYSRANNIYQPRAIRIFIPENRVIRLILLFDGKKYTFKKRIAIVE